ncbi:MAG: sigma-70 family RNA polymerase sigma factor [Anaerolineae bacterium]|nr:sigma-70 family RNA polymerase sigma factor [Anaerolineae bacterium]
MTKSYSPVIAGDDPLGSDETGIVQAARQDPKAFGALYLRYVEQVYRYLYSKLDNVHEAEDLTAQTFLAAFESFEILRNDDHFAAWLFTIARNKAMDHFRKNKQRETLHEPADIPAEDDPLSSVIRSEQALALSKSIRNLTEEEQEMLRLRFLAEMSYVQIGRILHRNEGAIKKAIYRLLARLQSQLEAVNE